MTETPSPAARQAFLALQQDLPAIELDAATKNYRYASLPTLLSAVLPVIWKHGFFLKFVGSRPAQGEHAETAVLRHVDTGDVFSSQMSSPIDFPAAGGVILPQKVGMVATYVRRYALLGLLGICAGYERDDDMAVDAPSPKTPPALPEPPANAGAGWFTARARLLAKNDAPTEQKAHLHNHATARGFTWNASSGSYELAEPDA